jgi:hypothetical protein
MEKLLSNGVEIADAKTNLSVLIIRLRSKEDFKKCRDEYKGVSSISWKMYMWSFFRSETCYIPSQDCFISLDKAIELKMFNIKEWGSGVLVDNNIKTVIKKQVHVLK